MKKLFVLISLTVFSFSNAFAVTLYDALNQTYQNNIQLNAERANIKASEEDINISKADYKPTLTLSGSKSIESTNKLTNQSGCLLYTSPSPRDRQKSRMPSSA